MYGGVSLAIYINGVVQELLRMVRATAADDSGDLTRYTYDELDPTERVYRRLAQTLGGEPANPDPLPDDPIRVRFVVDILSGTSAGGINSIFLAKALANDQGLENLRKLWIQEGDISVLLNDQLSTTDVSSLEPQKPPRSLLNSRRMYRKLVEAFNGMEDGTAEDGRPLVEELDLFVTATDISGMPIGLQLADRLVREKKHRQVFHFAYRDPNRYGTVEPRHDFGPEYNAFLAFAARCTSSFPFAFEPMRLADIDEDRDERWQKFYSDYQAMSGIDAEQFAERAFGDGGYLDNKPFSYAIDTLGTRAPKTPSDRLLIYIEPNPQEAPSAEAATPNAIENSAAALLLARYETIREDLQRVLERNQLLDRVDRILCGTDDDIARREKAGGWDVNQWLESDLDDMIGRKGLAYGSYLRLRVELLTDELAGLVIGNSDWDPLSDESRAMGVLVRTWRDDRYCYYKDPEDSEKDTFHGFLLDFDLSFYIRRLEFVLRRANEILPLGRRGLKCLKDCGCEIGQRDSKDRRAFQESLRKVRAELADHLLKLRLRRTRLFERNPQGAAGRIVGRMRLSREQLLRVLQEQREAAVRATGERTDEMRTARAILESAPGLIRELADVLSQSVTEAVPIVQATKRTAGYTPDEDGKLQYDHGAQPSDPAARGAWTLGYYMHRFTLFDLITLPILYATRVRDEHDPVEVIRVSPRDATSLIDEEGEGESRRKLGGTTLANFGAFLDRGWRENDILWGRLDGAERIVDSMLPAALAKHRIEEDEPTLRDKLVAQAQESILADFSGERAMSVARTMAQLVTRYEPEGPATDYRELERHIIEQGNPSPSAEKVVFASLYAALQPARLRQFFHDFYEIYRDPDRELTLRSLARATRIIGQMLEDVADQYSVGQKWAAWVTRLGRLFWGLVEISVPRGLLTLLARYWQQLLLMLAILLIAGGAAFTEPGARNVGWGLLALIAAVGSARRLLGDYMRNRTGFLRFLLVLGVFVVFLFAANGVWRWAESWEVVRAWLVARVAWLEGVFAWISKRFF
jgi:patatin-related protein